VTSLDPEAVISWGTGPAVALSFSVNFGMFAGREVSRTELERLGETLLGVVEVVSVTAESRYEFGRRSSANLHQVRVDVDHDALPPGEGDVELLRGRIGWCDPRSRLDLDKLSPSASAHSLGSRQV